MAKPNVLERKIVLQCFMPVQGSLALTACSRRLQEEAGIMYTCLPYEKPQDSYCVLLHVATT